MVSLTLALRYVTSASRYQSRSTMHIRGLILRNSTELAEAVPVTKLGVGLHLSFTFRVKVTDIVFKSK